jgi:pyruvate kinase
MHLPKLRYYWNIHERMKLLPRSEKESVAATAVQLSFEINTNVIVCFTESGSMARMLAKYRPKAFIVSIG